MTHQKPCVYCTIIAAIHALENIMEHGEHEPLATTLHIAADMAYRIDRLAADKIYLQLDEWQERFAIQLRYHRAQCNHLRSPDVLDDTPPF
jgi:hypothetical protein